jgi:hypothetical protein
MRVAWAAGRRARLLAALALLAALQACGEPGETRHGGKRADGTEREPANPTMSEVTRLDANDRYRINLADVKIALKLAPEQAPLWRAYEEKAIAVITGDERAAGAPEDNAPAQIERRVRAMRGRVALMEQLSDAALRLYAGLTEEQKRVADRLLPATVPAVSFGPSTIPQGNR